MAREMKCTGIEWLGEIPEPWATPKLLNVLREKICDGPHETPNYTEEGIPFVSIDSLNESKDINFSVVKRFISQEDYELYSKKTRIEEGDILFSKAATIGKTAIVGKEVFMVWSPLAVIKRDKDKVNIDYLYYLLNCDHLIRHIALSGSMNTQINVGMRELEQARIPLPPISEQQAIAGFLDTECDRIDAVLDQTRVSIEEYKKLKQAIITQAVTKGIRPGRKMKDSGIEWVGEIPDDWACTLLKRHCAFQTGSTPPTVNKQWYDGDLDWFTPADFNEKYYLIDSSRKLSQLAREDGVATMIPRDTVMIIGIGGTAGKIGYTTKECSCNQQITAIKADDEVCSKYLMYWMIANTTRLKDTALYTTLPIINNQTIGQYPLLVPAAMEEQEEISKYLDSKCLELDRLLEGKAQLINELESYKKSLIYEYVTGKKEVQ